MGGGRFFIWESYSDANGEVVPLDQIVEELRRYSSPSIILLCSYISIRLHLGSLYEDPDPSAYSSLLFKLFPKETAERLIDRMSSQSPQRRVFHRRLLLLTVKLALIHCDNSGIDAALNPGSFGQIFLKLNDHFAFRHLLPDASVDNRRGYFLRMLLNTLGMKEFSVGRYDFALIRSWRMCKLIAPTLREHPDYTDIDNILRQEIGIDYSTFEALAIGAATKYTTEFRAPIETSPLMTILMEGMLTGGIVPIEHVRSFLGEVSGDMSQLEAEAKKSPTLNNDLSLFRKYPFANLWISVTERPPILVHLLLDQGLLFEKVISSPYWAGVREVPKGFARFWGAMFEAHIGGLLEEACKGTNSIYVHTPRLPTAPGQEICDGLIIRGNTVVLLEYKSSILTAKAKYGGDPDELDREIRKKFVRDDRSHSPKAAAQLANAAKLMFSTTNNLGNL